MASHHDSLTVLDETGAEDLRGEGHALVKFTTTTEIQVMYLEPEMARNLIKHTYVKNVENKQETKELKKDVEIYVDQ